MENKHTWNSDNKCIQIHSPNNIFIFNKKKQWILSVVTSISFFFFFLQGTANMDQISYMAISVEFSTIHKG